MIRIRLGGESQIEDVVGRMTGGHKYTLSHGCFVNGTLICLLLAKIFGLAGFEPNERTISEKNLQITFDQRILIVAPLTSFEIHASNDYTVLRLRWMLINKHFEVIVQKIDSDVVFSCVVLLRASDKTLGEEESCNPQNFWKTILLPFLEPLQSCEQIFSVASKTLKRWETLVEPHFRNLSNFQAIKSSFKLSR